MSLETGNCGIGLPHPEHTWITADEDEAFCPGIKVDRLMVEELWTLINAHAEAYYEGGDLDPSLPQRIFAIVGLGVE